MNKFKELRKEKGLTQVELSKIFNIDQTTVSKWELEKAIPDTAMLIKLAEFYDVSTDYLLSRSNYYYPDNIEKFDDKAELSNVQNRLRELRKAKNLTIANTAENLEIPFETYRSYEIGQRQADYDTLFKFADYFGVSVDYLLGREEHKNIIERPPYDITDKQLIDFMKLYKLMTDLQKAQVFGYVVAMLEGAGINVKSVLKR